LEASFRKSSPGVEVSIAASPTLDLRFSIFSRSHYGSVHRTAVKKYSLLKTGSKEAPYFQ
jgi:hypothetical protein